MPVILSLDKEWSSKYFIIHELSFQHFKYFSHIIIVTVYAVFLSRQEWNVVWCDVCDVAPVWHFQFVETEREIFMINEWSNVRHWVSRRCDTTQGCLNVCNDDKSASLSPVSPVSVVWGGREGGRREGWLPPPLTEVSLATAQPAGSGRDIWPD